MARRRHTHRTAFYGKMKVLFWSAAGVNSVLAMAIARMRGHELAGVMLAFSLLCAVMAVIEIFDSRPWQNDLGTMIGIAVVYCAFFVLAMFCAASWVLAAAFILENVLIWRYFVRNRPHQ